MTRRRHEHGPNHDLYVALAAIATLLFILVLSELTDTDPEPAPVPPQTVEQGRYETALSGSTSRSLPRPEIPLPGAGHPDTSGRSETNGEVKPRPVVGQTLACIRWHESRGDYQAFNGIEHYGAYQLSATYSDDWARKYGYGEWAAVTADRWPPSVQDAVAVALYADWPGAWSTLGDCT